MDSLWICRGITTSAPRCCPPHTIPGWYGRGARQPDSASTTFDLGRIGCTRSLPRIGDALAAAMGHLTRADIHRTPPIHRVPQARRSNQDRGAGPARRRHWTGSLRAGFKHQGRRPRRQLSQARASQQRSGSAPRVVHCFRRNPRRTCYAPLGEAFILGAGHGPSGPDASVRAAESPVLTAIEEPSA